MHFFPFDAVREEFWGKEEWEPRCGGRTANGALGGVGKGDDDKKSYEDRKLLHQ